MIGTRAPKWVIAGGIVATLLSAACGPVPLPMLGTSQVNDTTNASGPSIAETQQAGASTRAVPNSRVPGRQSVAVRRGSIAEQVNLFGEVVGRDAQPVAFAAPIRVGSVLVKTGDSVTEGQVLAEADASDITRQMTELQQRVSDTQTRLDQ